MTKVVLAIDVVETTRKGEPLGHKVYINDFEHTTKFPRKPGDFDRQRIRELAETYEQDGAKFTAEELRQRLSQPEPVDYYTGTLIGSINQALIDWQIWKAQGYKRAE